MQRGALVYTDRSIYRPQQKILWKVIGWTGRAADARFAWRPDWDRYRSTRLDFTKLCGTFWRMP